MQQESRTLYGIFCYFSALFRASPTMHRNNKSHSLSGFLVAHCARDSGGMVGFCARRAQRALFQTHSALTDAVFYTKNLGLISEISM